MATGNALEVISGGTSGLVKLRANGTHVEKAPYPKSDIRQNTEDLRREYLAYQKLPQHARLLRLHPDSTPNKLVLPYLANGCLHEFLREAPSCPAAQRLQWAADAAEGLHLLHCAGIVHGDINSWNFLLDDDVRLCIIDFAGSTIDGEAGSAFEGARYCLPRSWDDPSTVRTDLFALGSLLYEIGTGETPYQDYGDEEVEEWFGKGRYPATRDLPLGRVVLGCWMGTYDSAASVREDIAAVVVERRGETSSFSA